MKLLLIGCGKMGGAMLGGWMDQGIDPDTISIIERNPDLAKDLAKQYGVRTYSALDDLPKGYHPEVILLAVKPQMMAEACADLKDFSATATFISIAAGKTLCFYEEIFGPQSAVIRVMPNTPSAVRRGISGVIANAGVSDEAKDFCETLLRAIGDVVWLKDEAQMDALTAVSGSGPAYVFYMTECLTEAGIKAGLPKEMATRLARATVAGAGELMRQSSEEAGTLRQNVTSPGGTTEAGLAILMKEDGLAPLMEECVNAAVQRNQDLS